ncbi:hypothetical protein [Ruegeria sp.]|uniref:hypothetical protein n=1 Tax=Ruegeria sp. TaxID=1879320 RepID=UPI00231C3642|nr:hypothetical protein [Ruegeria sp.]MDA7966955.1 hypothetical protein [Ruegeria sp.]
MPAGTILGATQVMGGNNTLIATSTQGNYENQEIDLIFATAAAMAGIQRGANYTLIDAAGGRFSCVSRYVDPGDCLARFAVVS